MAEVRLYPDLGEFYNQGVVEYGSSVDIPITRGQGLLPTAPPPSEPDLDPRHQFALDLNITAPEEPALDYTLEPDYDLDDFNDLNLNDAEKKILNDKVVDFPPQPRDKKDFNAWMTWRKQVNRQLASVILIKRGKQVHLRKSEMNRKPLSKQNVESVVKDAKTGKRGADKAEMTSLPGRPYIMYGIPRVKLSTARH
nr:hypothetical protein BaRGS_029865 [Batillaria attramentaria]